MPSLRKFIKLTAIFAAGLSAVFLAGCAKSTEQKAAYVAAMFSELDSQFRVHYDGIEALSDALIVSNLYSVSLQTDNSVKAYIFDNSEFKNVIVEDPAAWTEMLSDAGVDSANTLGNNVTLQNLLSPPSFFGDSAYTFSYGISEYEMAHSCLPQYLEAECGSCVEQLDERWHVAVYWFPRRWIEEFNVLDNKNAGQYESSISKLQPEVDACIARFFEGN